MDSIGRWLRRTSACMPRSDVTLVLHRFRHCASSAALPNTASAESQSSVPLIMLAAIQQQVGAVGVEIDENVTFSRGCGARRFRYWRGALTSCVDALRGGINSKPNGNAIAQYENSCLSICLDPVKCHALPAPCGGSGNERCYTLAAETGTPAARTSPPPSE